MLAFLRSAVAAAQSTLEPFKECKNQGPYYRPQKVGSYSNVGTKKYPPSCTKQKTNTFERRKMTRTRESETATVCAAGNTRCQVAVQRMESDRGPKADRIWAQCELPNIGALDLDPLVL